MLLYILRRIGQMIPVFIGVTIIMFLVRSPAVVPGDPVRMIAGERSVTEEVRAAIIEKFGLDQPIYVQYGKYMGGLLQGDLGDSYQQRRPVTHILFAKFPNTFKLAGFALLIEAIFGIAAGILSAVKRYSFWDVMVTLSTSVLVSIPVFWLGMVLQYIFAIKLKILPATGLGGNKFPEIVHLIMPAVTLASVSTAYSARIARSQLLEVMGMDYMRTAAAKGLSGGQVIWRHGLKNAMIPVVTFLGLDLGAMVAGTILTETVFNWPGVGLEMYRAILVRDWPIVTGGVVIIVISGHGNQSAGRHQLRVP